MSAQAKLLLPSMCLVSTVVEIRKLIEEQDEEVTTSKGFRMAEAREGGGCFQERREMSLSILC